MLDGVPRTVKQAQILAEILRRDCLPLTAAIQLSVSKEMLLERIRLRGAVNQGARTDDDLKIAERRLEVYEQQTAPVADYYHRGNKLYEISGEGSVEQVFQRISGALQLERSRCIARQASPR